MALFRPLAQNRGMMMPAHHHTVDDDRRWTRVLDRDRSADGSFVYAVSSTGIYCRPSCASRRPNRARVVFFETPADAQRAGYRACRRCRPDELVGPDAWTGKIQRACVYLANVEGHPSLARLARLVGGSPYHLQRNFKRIVGVTPREYADACRLRKVKRGLRAGADVTGAILDAGYGSSSRFYERAVPRLGMRPGAYRKGGEGMSIRYATTSSPIGELLVASTARGICAVSLGASRAALESALVREFPRADITPDPGVLEQTMKVIVAHLEGKQPRIDLPLDVRATAFQWQVWQALGTIPYGETRSYAEIAAAIGHPRAVRAVARACASNPAALVIPCHRVVSSSGDAGGYRWGAERKKALLAREGGHGSQGQKAKGKGQRAEGTGQKRTR